MIAYIGSCSCAGKKSSPAFSHSRRDCQVDGSRFAGSNSIAVDFV
jgi:hypothetical protein